MLSLGGLALLTGCDLSTNSGVDAALKFILRFDDEVQAALFSQPRPKFHPRPVEITRLQTSMSTAGSTVRRVRARLAPEDRP